MAVLEKPETLTRELASGFDVIISNWNSFVDDGVKEWPEEARTALIDFVRQNNNPEGEEDPAFVRTLLQIYTDH